MSCFTKVFLIFFNKVWNISSTAWMETIFIKINESIFNVVLAARDMLAGAQNQIVATGHAKCIQLTTITINISNYLPDVFAHAHGARLTFCLASYAFKISLKSIFNLILAAGDILAGAQSQNVATGHVKCIKLTTIA